MAAILIVDDERLVCMAIAATIEADGGARCFPAATIAAAEELLDGHSFSLAILDVALKDGTVQPLAQRAAAMGIAIIYMTGLHREDAKPDTMPAGLWLQKPIGTAALLGAVGAVLADTGG